MNCPADQTPLRSAPLDHDLRAFECGGCVGHWIRFGDYLAWRERQPGDMPEVPPEAAGEVPEARESVRRCADCGHLLARYTVGHGVPFAIDRCGSCNGVWLDGAEWEALRARGLHDNLHQMFGPGWQFAVRTEERRQRTEAQFARQLGGDYERARDFGEWLAEHPRRSELLAYLQAQIR